MYDETWSLTHKRRSARERCTGASRPPSANARILHKARTQPDGRNAQHYVFIPARKKLHQQFWTGAVRKQFPREYSSTTTRCHYLRLTVRSSRREQLAKRAFRPRTPKPQPPQENFKRSVEASENRTIPSSVTWSTQKEMGTGRLSPCGRPVLEYFRGYSHEMKVDADNRT